MVSAVLAVALLGATGAAWYYAAQARTPEQLADERAEPEDSVVTVEVEQGLLTDLMEFEAVLNRTGGYAVPAPTAVEGAEIALASDMPLEVGDEVESATVLLEVSGRPMIALPGEVPAYRDLVEGDSGPDVEQLQEALQALYGTPVTGEFDSRTADDVRRLYADLGYEALTIEAAADDSGGADGEDGAPEDPAGDGASAEDGAGRQTGGEQVRTADLVKVPAAEVVFLPRLPMQVGDIAAEHAAPVEGTVMTLVSGDWRLEAELTEQEAAELSRSGEAAELEYGPGPLEGMEVEAFELETRAVESEGQDEVRDESEEAGTVERTFAVFAFDAEGLENREDLVPGTEQQVVLVRARSAEDALIVPLSAVWTDGRGRTMITVVEGETDRLVEVTVSIRHEGRGVVEPVDGTLAVGDEVVVAWRDQEVDG